MRILELSDETSQIKASIDWVKEIIAKEEVLILKG